MQEAIDFASRTKTIEPCEFLASIGSASRTKTIQPLHWYKSTLGSPEHIVHIMGRGAERRQWRMKRRRKRSEQQVQAPLQGVCTPIANLTERAKRSETVGSSPTVTTTAQPLKIKGCDFFALPRSRVPRGTFLSGSFGAHSQKYHIV